MQGDKTYWFPAKRYGWGWGFPGTWQGLLVLVAYAALLAVGVRWLLPQHHQSGFLLYAGALTVILVLVCWLKGEPPGWRWGQKD